MSARGTAHVKRMLTDALVRAGYSSAMVADARRSGRWWLETRSHALMRGRGLVRGWTILWTENGRADLVPVEVPLPRSGEVTVEMQVTAVSPGTERAQFLRLPNAQVELPYIPGYSGVGLVRAVGRAVSNIDVGARVAVIRAPHASVATLPATDVFPLPATVRPEAGALIRLAIVSEYGIFRGALSAGESVVVVGAGPVGALGERVARSSGAGQTTVVARSSRRRQAMLEAGAGRFLSTAEDMDEVAHLSAPLVVEATGAPEAVALAVRLAAPDGRVVLLGSPRGKTLGLPLDLIRERRLHLIGAHVAQLPKESARVGRSLEQDFGNAFLAELATSRIDVADLVGNATDPREATSFYRLLAEDPGLIGAFFDWRVLLAHDRPARSRIAQAPPIGARGVDLERKPQKVALRLTNEFADAAGMLRIALVGCGDIALKNAAGASSAPNVNLVACFDPVTTLAEELSRDHGCDVEPTFESILDRKDVDAVFLCVPHDLHAPMALQAIDAGKHVVVEKPLANTLSAAVETVAAAEAAGVTLSVCFPHRYMPASVLARQLVIEGALGELGGTMTSS